VSRILLRSNAFVRSAKKLIKKHPYVADQLHPALKLLEEDAFHPVLKTHKVKGDLEGLWSCSIGYEIRLIFEFVQYQGREAILLGTIGTHDEVY
jgi:mRNA-degrading endonuclease YafQ of YafQ-DinJ toxin-antitoxin module